MGQITVTITKTIGDESVTVTMTGNAKSAGEGKKMSLALAYNIREVIDEYALKVVPEAKTLGAGKAPVVDNRLVNGTVDESALQLVVDMKEGKVVRTVKTGKNNKFGVPLYPEHAKVLEGRIEVDKPGVYDFPEGSHCFVQYEMGKPKRVVDFTIAEGDE